MYVILCIFSITYIQGCTDIDEFVGANKMQEPHIVAAEADEKMDYYIYIKSEHLLCADSLADALADLICVYFVFSIAYPKNLYPALIFLQHFVLGVKDSQQVSSSVSSLCSCLCSFLHS